MSFTSVLRLFMSDRSGCQVLQSTSNYASLRRFTLVGRDMELDNKFYCINTNALQWPYMTIWLAQPTNQSNNSLKFHTKILKSLKFVALQLHIVLVLNHNLEFPVSTESTYPYLLLHRHLPCLLVIKIINNVTNFVLDTSDTRFLGR